MTADEFITALEAKQLLPEPIVKKLRQKTASEGKPLSAKSLARFLIDKGHLSKHQAMAVLASGGEVKAPAPKPEAKEEPAPAEPSGIDFPDDELMDLSSSAEWTFDEGGGFAEAAEQPAATTTKSKKRKKGKKENEWDSPLLLIGGGALVLLLIVGGVIAFILSAEGADKTLEEARNAMNDGSYGKGIANYQKFVEKWPNHSDFSTARVELAMAQIRQMLESGNHSKALETTTTELRLIGSEPAFNEAQEQLSELLPRIARALADKAEASQDAQETKKLFEEAKSALGLTNNTKYIPKSRRDNTELEGIRQTIDRIERRQESMTDLATALDVIQKAIAEGDTKTAYATQQALVEKHPALVNNPQLAEALVNISQAESKSIQFVEEPIEASSTEPESSITATLALANLRQPGSAPLQGVYCAQVGGIAYGIETASGKLLWRRYLGPTLGQIYPQTVGNDLLLIEWQPADGNGQRQTLIRVDAATGSLKWRLALDDDVAEPVVSGGRIFLAGASGKLHVVEAESGTRLGYVQFAQPLETPPGISEQAGKLYLAGDHSSLYTLSTKDLSCTGVYYTKHPRGSIVAPPVVALDKAVVIENDGAKTCKLRLFALDGEGNIAQPLTEERLGGRAVRQPQVDGRRFMVMTDRGQVAVYEVSLGTEGEVLTPLASRAARGGSPFVRFGRVDGKDIWFAENAINKFAIAPTGNRLSVQELTNDYNRSQFVAPIEVRDGVLLHVRSRRGRAGFTVTATDTKTGKAYWQTDIAVPPAGNPLATDSPVALLETDSNGEVYRFDPTAIRSRIQNESLKAPALDDDTSGTTVYDFATLLAGGSAVFSATDSENLLLYRPVGNQPVARGRLPGALACRPVAFSKGWLAPLSVGQVFYLDGESGQPLAAPFQPELQPGSSIEWLPAGVAADDQFIISDGTEKVYLVELQQGNAQALIAVGEAGVGPSPLSTGMVVLGDRAYAGTSDGRLAVFQLPSLEADDRIELGANIIWGPYAVSDHLVLRTDAGDLVAIDSKGTKVWQTPAPEALYAGPPLESAGDMIIATQTGAVVTVNLNDGSEAGQVDTGQPIAGGPVLLGKRVVVAARDGALLVIDTP